MLQHEFASVIPSYSMVNPYSAFLYIDYFRSVQGDPNDVNAIKGVLAGEVVQIYPATSSWPRFSANKNSVDQAAVVADTETKVTFTTEDYDVGAAYDAANSKWIPGRIGGVHITSGLKWTTDNHEDGAVRLMIYKNGAEIRRAQIYTNASGDCLLIAADIICDAITDYFEIYCWHTSAAGNRKVEEVRFIPGSRAFYNVMDKIQSTSSHSICRVDFYWLESQSQEEEDNDICE